MPVHFNSFIADREEELEKNLFANIISKYTQDAEDIFVSNDKKCIHMTNYFKDVHTGEKIGKVVITLIVKENAIEIVDIDITLLSKNKIKLHFEEKLKESSEANEYYEVFDPEDERHFDIETVNRYTLQEDEIEGTDQEVYLSCFPFQLEVFDDEEHLNESFGFSKKEIDIPGIGKQVLGMAPDMMAVGSVMTGKDEPSSFIIGKIKDYRDVEVNIADIIIKFKIINLITAVGEIPVAAHEENFDLRKIEKGKLIGMITDVKADFKE